MTHLRRSEWEIFSFRQLVDHTVAALGMMSLNPFLDRTLKRVKRSSNGGDSLART
jgi:hypothetical protein